MNKFLINKPIILMILFLILQLGGQTAAGFSGREVGFFNLYTLLSYSALVLRAIIWMLILKNMPLTVAYPFTGMVYLLILPLSIFIFGENPHWSSFAGAALIFCGIVLTAFGAVKNE